MRPGAKVGLIVLAGLAAAGAALGTRSVGPLPFLAFVIALATAASFAVEVVARRLRQRFPQRRSRGLLFLATFWLLTAAVMLWLLAGIAAAIAKSAPGSHQALHRRAGTERQIRVTAAGYAFDAPQLTFVAGRYVTVIFANEDRGVAHNFSLYEPVRLQSDFTRDDPGLELVYAGKVYKGNLTREFSFLPPSPGFYIFQCDVEDASPAIGFHGDFMYGVAQVVAPDTPEATPPSGAGAAIARGLASAIHYVQPPGAVALDYVFSAISLALGIFLVRVRPRDRVARFFALGLVGTAAAYNIQGHAALDVIPPLANAIHPLFVHPVSGLAYAYAFILFPDGRLVPRVRTSLRHVQRALVFLVLMVVVIAGDLFEPAPGPGHAQAFVQSFGLLIPLVGAAAQTYRLRRAHTAEEQQQSRVLLWALVPALAFGLFVVAIRVLGGPSGAFSSERVTDLETLAFRAFQPVFILIPAALVVGILRYRLWDLDVVISRTIVYGSLAGLIGGAYVLVVVGLGTAVGAERSNLLTIATIAGVALAFEPARRRLQRLANRLVYGERAAPYEVMAALSRQLAGARSAGEVLERIAEAVARAVGAAGARASVMLPGGEVRARSWPAGDSPGHAAHAVPVVHLTEHIGEIGVYSTGGADLRPADQRLLAGLASQAGLALHGVRLAADLERRLAEITAQSRELAVSRQRLLSAQDAERRRVEREIREGVERTLESVADLLTEAVRVRSRARLESILVGAGALASEALDHLRTLARGIFPPILADKGVVAALRSQTRLAPVLVQVRSALADDDRFDQSAEAAVYFCCMQAVRDATRSGATEIEVRLGREDGWIAFGVRGGASTPDADESLQIMSDRVAAIGGNLGSDGDGIVGRVPATPSR